MHLESGGQGQPAISKRQCWKSLSSPRGAGWPGTTFFLLLCLGASHLIWRTCCRRPAWRLCHLSGNVRFLPGSVTALWMAGICASSGMSLRQTGWMWSWCPLPIWIPYKAGGSKGWTSYLLCSGHALFIALLADWAADSSCTHGCSNPAEWLALRWCCPLWSGWSRRQTGKGPSFLFLLPLSYHPPSLCLPGLDTSCANFMPWEGPSDWVPWQTPVETQVAAAQPLTHNLQGRIAPVILELQQGPAGI